MIPGFEFGGIDFSVRDLIVVAIAAIVGGFLRGFVGFGGALALVPPLALVLGPKLGVGVASFVGMPAAFQFIPEILRNSERERIAPVGLAILAGAPLGSLILTHVDQRAMTGVIGGLVMLMALATWWAPGRRIPNGLGINLLAGCFSGIMQGAAGIGGPPSVVVLMAQGGDVRRLRADVLAVTSSIAICGAISHWWFGILTLKAGAIALLLVPLFVGSTSLGSRYFDRGGARHFRTAALLVLLIIGFVAVFSSVRSWIGNGS
ncbi:MAG: sulfite exporter TauE/SafE family protein [Proteobacteria bacterium]|nr:sulfite exporter TauE/SafE family protein [Pseudomonadota bacterium]